MKWSLIRQETNHIYEHVRLSEWVTLKLAILTYTYVSYTILNSYCYLIHSESNNNTLYKYHEVMHNWTLPCGLAESRHY